MFQCCPHAVTVHLPGKIQLKIFFFQSFLYFIAPDHITNLSHIHRLLDHTFVRSGHTKFFCRHSGGYVIHVKNDLVSGNLVYTGLHRFLCFFFRHAGQIHTFQINMIQNRPFSGDSIVGCTGVKGYFIGFRL